LRFLYQLSVLFSISVGKRQALLVFSAMDFSVGKKPNVLDCALAFFCMPHNGLVYLSVVGIWKIKIVKRTEFDA